MIDGTWKKTETFSLKTCSFDVSILTFLRSVWNVKVYLAPCQTSKMKLDISLIKLALFSKSRLSYVHLNLLLSK